MDPGASASASPRVMCVRPISTATSTDTDCRRSSSPSVGAPSVLSCRLGSSISSFGSVVMVAWVLLDGDVGEEDLMDLHVRVLLDALGDLLLELLALLYV